MRLQASDEPSSRPGKCKARFELLSRYMRPGDVGAELGVFRGNFVDWLLKSRPKKLYLVDPWFRLTQKWDWTSIDCSTVDAFAAILSEFREEIESGRVEPRVEFSDEFLAHIPDHHLDWIYLDTFHGYHDTKLELSLAVRKVKPSGFIMGDDFESNPSHVHHGVYRAVREFEQANLIELIFDDASKKTKQFIARPALGSTQDLESLREVVRDAPPEKRWELWGNARSNVKYELRAARKQAEALADLGRMEEALELCQELRRRFPDRPFVDAVETDCAARVGGPKAGLSQISQLPPARQANLEVALQRISWLLELGQGSEAAMLGEQLSQEHPDHPRVFQLRINAALQLGDIQSAIRFATAGCDKLPGNLSLQMRLGKLLQSEGSFKDAARTYEHVLELVPTHEGALRALCSVARCMNDNETTLRVLRKLQNMRPSDPGPRQQLCEYFHAQLRMKEVAECIEEASRADAINEAIGLISLRLAGLSHTGERSATLHAFATLMRQAVISWFGPGEREDLEAPLAALRRLSPDSSVALDEWHQLDHHALIMVDPKLALCLAAGFADPAPFQALKQLVDVKWNELARDERVRFAEGLVDLRRYSEAHDAFERAGVKRLRDENYTTIAAILEAAFEANAATLEGYLDEVMSWSDLAEQPSAGKLLNRICLILHARGEAVRWLEHPFGRWKSSNSVLVRATALIEEGCAGKAIEEIDGYLRNQPPTRLALLTLARAAHDVGNTERKHAALEACIKVRPEMQTLRGHVDFKRVDNRPIAPKKGEVSAIIVAKNELLRLRWLLPYYRNLGVSRFLLVDNGSTDGTVDFVRNQEDVHVFVTGQDYGETHNGMRWCNWLAKEYLLNHWVLTVDADEALAYPDCESVLLPDLCDQLDSAGEQGLVAPLLDMYASGDAHPEYVYNGDNLLAITPYFDGTGYRWRRSFTCPYIAPSGGPRERVLWRAGGDPLVAHPPTLIKIPLVKWAYDTEYLWSTHEVSPCTVSKITGALLHFKFLPDAVERMHQQATAGTGDRYCRMAWERELNQCLKHYESSHLYYDGSVRYEGSWSLECTGFIRRRAKR